MRRWPKEKVNTYRNKEEILLMLSLDFELGGFLVQEVSPRYEWVEFFL